LLQFFRYVTFSIEIHFLCFFLSERNGDKFHKEGLGC
jgi:hypothetical protein